MSKKGTEGTPKVQKKSSDPSKSQSGWSNSWGSGNKQSPPIQKYHNQSKIVFGGKDHIGDGGQESKTRKDIERVQRVQEYNNKIPDYNPKNGGKSSLHFGDDKPDYRRKDEFYSTKQGGNFSNTSSFKLG